ncbi:adhesive plaque matrix protein 2 [Monomorium pharaonis]|uniref:adhesive plaque matrix protein 2 n=1 Tax=Monomorium pharaonis TaxID=307658 RepID=UPI001747084D|nr:adhesive plaque matrix protein 2 [Monomorium pharaonis]
MKRYGPPCDALSCGDNGTCHPSGICVCNDDYARDTNGDCVPICVPACTHGTCTALHRCTCHDGYAPRNESSCEPICKGGCQNGDCISPNHCVCHDGFIPNLDRHSGGPECIPLCTRNCSGHGGCDSDRCECHFGWTGPDCDQPTMCVITVAYNHADVKRITIRNDTNSTIMRFYEDAPYCQCDEALGNETLCYMMQSDDGNTTSNIACLFSTDLPCYTTPRYNASINITKIVWPFVTIAILVATGLTTAAYLMYRKRQEKKLTTVPVGPSTNVFVRESFATEFLLTDNEL